VFDETIFPFEHLHANVGALLWKEILLLPNHLLNPDCGDESCTDQLLSDATNDSGSAALVQEQNSEENSEAGIPLFPCSGAPLQHPVAEDLPGKHSQVDPA
jgi:hypothetical protein